MISGYYYKLLYKEITSMSQKKILTQIKNINITLFLYKMKKKTFIYFLLWIKS